VTHYFNLELYLSLEKIYRIILIYTLVVLSDKKLIYSKIINIQNTYPKIHIKCIFEVHQIK